MAIRRVTGAVSPSELVFADANALGVTYDGSGTTIERGETFTLPAGGTTAVSNGALRLEALKGDCVITNNGNSTLTNASGVNGTIVMRSGASDFPAFVRNSSLGSMSVPAREDFSGDVSGTINSNATFPAGHLIQTKSSTFAGIQTINYSSGTTDITSLSCTMTITSGNKVWISANVNVGTGQDDYGALYITDGSSIIFQNTTAVTDVGGNAFNSSAAITPIGTIASGVYLMSNNPVSYLWTPSTTLITVKVAGRCTYANSSSNIYINRPENTTNDGHHVRGTSTLTIFEVQV